MKEFLIFNKVDKSNGFGVNATLKVFSEGEHAVFKGEIFLVTTLKGEFCAFALAGGKLYELAFSSGLNFEGKIPLNEAKNGFCVAVFSSENQTPVLYCRYKEGGDLSSLLSALKSKSSEDNYDDEMLATHNYYEEENFETKHIYNDDNHGGFEDKKSPPKNEAGSEALLYEELSQKLQGGNFYPSVKERFDKIIYCHPSDTELCSVIPDGEFVKIPYDNDRSYSVGRVYECGEVKYLCYAVKGKYMETPPELKEFCRFLPLSPYKPLSEGYFVIFQSAESGKII
ncbi:MAG: hypothetical protein IJA97_02590 [Clostridia bacterium]|nr:hypothetical protein [Clostridia bacterium]